MCLQHPGNLLKLLSESSKSEAAVCGGEKARGWGSTLSKGTPQLDEPSWAGDANMFINSPSIGDKHKVGNPDETARRAGKRPGSRYTCGKALARSGYLCLSLN